MGGGGHEQYRFIIQDLTKSSKVSLIVTLAGVWLALASTAILLQRGAGAYESDFGGHPDEGAHFVTGLMVRDYLVSGIPAHPMRYAEDYYSHYPKVALGHYPPGFYALEGVWLAIFPVTRDSVLLFLAVLAATFGTLLFWHARRRVGSLPVALALAGGAVALPLTQTLTTTVMSDLLVAILVILSACSFVRFLEKERWWDSLAFGFFAAAATMTKGSGLFLALLPPMAIILCGNYRILKKGSLWIAPIPVVLICGPWLYFSAGLTAEGMVDRTVFEHVGLALPYFATQAVRVFGFTLIVPAILGAVWTLRRPTARREPFWVVVLAVPVGLVIFYSAIPAGLEPRYLLPAIPFVLLLAAAGVRWALCLLPTDRKTMGTWAVAAGVGALFFLETFTIPAKEFAGYRAAVRDLVDTIDREGGALKVLISSDARGEGAFVSEVAILDEKRPSHTVDRSSKVLSRSDWLGRGYEEAFATDEELLSHLVEAGYDAVFIDETIPEVFLRPHHTRVARALSSSEAFLRLPDQSGEGGGRGSEKAIYVRAPARP